MDAFLPFLFLEGCQLPGPSFSVPGASEDGTPFLSLPSPMQVIGPRAFFPLSEKGERSFLSKLGNPFSPPSSTAMAFRFSPFPPPSLFQPRRVREWGRISFSTNGKGKGYIYSPLFSILFPLTFSLSRFLYPPLFLFLSPKIGEL